MKKKFISYALMAIAVITVSTGLVSCSDNGGDEPEDPTKTKEFLANQAILNDYVNKVVIPTYKSLADASILLAEDCADLSTQEKVDKACSDWLAARRYWELSEAFLFGAASDYNIDPHIDSWPLDLGQLDEVLKAGNIEDRIEAGTAGYGLLGFHAVEYVIFKEGSTGDKSNRNRDYSTITAAQANFAAAVAEDMRNQCVRLEAAWAGLDNVSAAKKKILADAELDPTLDYGERLIAAGITGNTKYKTQISAFEEIIVGASDIANEVGNTKISDPMASHQWSDVESPHSWNSVEDFTDNIRSVRNAYYGSLDGTISANSLSAYMAKVNSTADKKVKDCIENAISKIGAMPTPFRNYISETSGANYQAIMAAVAACNNLVDALDEAQELIKK
ncbi:MAG: peptidase M75 [Bacteroidales bacterium]|nr:peptidase M75 [Bacteroidales bacterium]